MPRSLVVDARLTIPGEEISVSSARSSGPGGQNVNKVNSKAVLRWSIVASQAIPDEVRQRFLSRFPTRVNKAGEVVLSCDVHRDLNRNLSDCYERLRQLLQVALAAPHTRKPTQPTRNSIQRRLTNKRHQSLRKQKRTFRGDSDE